MTTTAARADRVLLVDALSLLSEVADELVVKTARDTHFAAAVADGFAVAVTRGSTGVARSTAASPPRCTAG